MRSKYSLLGALCLSTAWVSAFCLDAPGKDSTASIESKAPPAEFEKQYVFLICPHTESTSSWSLFIVVDKEHPSKALALGLEVLTGKNSKELTYRGVLAAQKDPATRRNEIGRLDAKQFSNSKLEVKENNLLSIKVEETAEGLKLVVDARISADGHFLIGGAEQQRRSLILNYSRIFKSWRTQALTLEATDGHNAVGKYRLTLTGIVFTAGTTTVHRICAVDEYENAILLLDQ